MELGFIGAGNMATAMAGGFAKSGLLAGKTVKVFDVSPAAVQRFCEAAPAEAMPDAQSVVENADMIILAVKPQMMASVLSEIGEAITDDKTMVSIAAGLKLGTLQNMIGPYKKAIIRLMPNVNMLVSECITAVCGNSRVTPAALAYCLELMNAVGRAVELPEKDFPAFMAMAASSPAFVAMFVDALARFGVQHGIPRKLSDEIAAQAVMGTAATLLQTGQTPSDMIDAVCSPAGTTVAGIMELHERCFPAAVAAGAEATLQRDLKMQKELGK